MKFSLWFVTLTLLALNQRSLRRFGACSCKPTPRGRALISHVASCTLLEFATREKRCLVTRNRDDFIRLTVQFFNEHRPHFGVLIIPYTIPGDQFNRIARLLKAFSSRHPSGIEPYVIAFLSAR